MCRASLVLITCAACAGAQPVQPIPSPAHAATQAPAATALDAAAAELFVDSPSAGGPAATLRLVARGCAIRASTSRDRPVFVPVGSEAAIQAMGNRGAQEMVLGETRLWATFCPGETYVVQAGGDCQLHMDGQSHCR